ncbi:hypothetical protein [Campylobacter lanienae]|uniref:hypothetical protein n=1 Tax=Campylobacter lanienae TaxID=75658 RepID=UPI00242AB09C|nr:hypothetical protein [Campylobacter lanienae]MDD5786000.1 hypothetical protein [Campylobacter lanienae]
MKNLKDFMTELKGFNAKQMGAVAYNRMIKKHLSLDNKLELLFDDLRAYVVNELGEKKYDAIEKIVITFKAYEISINIILRALKSIKNGDKGWYFLNMFSIEALKEAVEIVLNDDDMEALLDRIKVKLYQMGNGDLDAKEVLETVLNDEFKKSYKSELIHIIAIAISKKYYNYFYRDLEISLNKIIDMFSGWGWSLEPKVKELIAKQEANQ